jgi:hypothetical protein
MLQCLALVDFLAAQLIATLLGLEILLYSMEERHQLTNQDTVLPRPTHTPPQGAGHQHGMQEAKRQLGTLEAKHQRGTQAVKLRLGMLEARPLLGIQAAGLPLGEQQQGHPAQSMQIHIHRAAELLHISSNYILTLALKHPEVMYPLPIIHKLQLDIHLLQESNHRPQACRALRLQVDMGSHRQSVC